MHESFPLQSCSSKEVCLCLLWIFIAALLFGNSFLLEIINRWPSIAFQVWQCLCRAIVSSCCSPVSLLVLPDTAQLFTFDSIYLLQNNQLQMPDAKDELVESTFMVLASLCY